MNDQHSVRSERHTPNIIRGVKAALQWLDMHWLLWVGTIVGLCVTYIVVLVISRVTLYVALFNWDEQYAAVSQARDMAIVTQKVTEHSGLPNAPEFKRPERMPSVFVWKVWARITEVRESEQYMGEIEHQLYSWVEQAEKDYVSRAH